jgi:hypothetical protein
MNQEQLKHAQHTSTPVALRPPIALGGGIARCKVLETGLQDPHRPHAGYHNHTRVLVEFSDGISEEIVSPVNPEVTVLNNNLSEWDADCDALLMTATQRQAVKEQYEQLAIIAGVEILHVDGLTEQVTLSGEQFQQLCYQLTDESDSGEPNVIDPPILH